jgi:hypothetical protein
MEVPSVFVVASSGVMIGKVEERGDKEGKCRNYDGDDAPAARVVVPRGQGPPGVVGVRL